MKAEPAFQEGSSAGLVMDSFDCTCFEEIELEELVPPIGSELEAPESVAKE